MLTAFFYVLVPMPYLFFGTSPASAHGTSNLASGWARPCSGLCPRPLGAASDVETAPAAPARPSAETLAAGRRWIDAGKFLTGFSAVGSVAIPAILFHAQKITGGALAMELGAVAVLGGTAFAADYLNSRDGYYAGY